MENSARFLDCGGRFEVSLNQTLTRARNHHRSKIPPYSSPTPSTFAFFNANGSPRWTLT